MREEKSSPGLTAVLKKLASGSEADVYAVIDNDFLHELTNCKALLDALHAGSPIQLAGLRQLLTSTGQTGINTLPTQAAYTLAQAVKLDHRWRAVWGIADENFTEANFWLWYTTVGKNGSQRGKAQLLRMLRAGHIDLAFTEEFFRDHALPTELDVDLYGEYFAYLPYEIEDLKRYAAYLIAGPALMNGAEIELAQRAVVLAAVKRWDLFLNVWLPTVIGEAEWQMVRHLAPDILRDLYAAVWTGGYEIYRTTRLNTQNMTATT